MEKSVHCKDDYEAIWLRNCESSDYEIFGPLIKIQKLPQLYIYPRITTPGLPPPKIVIVIVIVDSGIVGAVKHQIGR